MANKEVATLIRKVEDHGFTIVRGGSHYKVVSADGKVITTIPGSPSDWRWLENTYRDFRKAGYNLKAEVLPVEVRERLRLVRDDLATPTDDNHGEETNRIRFSLAKIGPTFTDKRYQAEVEDIYLMLGPEVGVHSTLQGARDTVEKLFSGGTLNSVERVPLDHMLTLLAEEEDKIRAFYRLVRRSRNLPEPEEEGPIMVEETLAPVEVQPERKQRVNITEMMPTDMGILGVSSVEEMVGVFIETLEQRNRMLIEESNKTQDLIDQLRQQYPGVQVEADSTENDGDGDGTSEPRSRVTHIGPASGGGTGNGSGTVTIPKDELKQKIAETLAEGGEWSQRELFEKFNVHQTAVSSAVRELIADKTVVVVTPGTGGRGNPTTYGSGEIYG